MCCCSQAPEVVIHLKCKGDHPWKQGPKGHWRECPQGHCHVTCWHCWLGGSGHRLGTLSSSGWHGVKSTSLGSDANFSSPDCFQGNAALLTPASRLHFGSRGLLMLACALPHTKSCCARQQPQACPHAQSSLLYRQRLCWLHASHTDRYGQEVLPRRQGTEEFSSLVFRFKH